MTCSVLWCAFTWEAFATLTSGALAVGAAGGVAYFQTRISKRQTDILDEQRKIAAEQVALESLKLRSELFQERMKIYNSTLTWLSVISVDARTPTFDEDAAFINGLRSSRFLFRPAAINYLEETWMLGHRLLGLRKRLEREDLSDDERTEAIAAAVALPGARAAKSSHTLDGASPCKTRRSNSAKSARSAASYLETGGRPRLRVAGPQRTSDGRPSASASALCKRAPAKTRPASSSSDNS